MNPDAAHDILLRHLRSMGNLRSTRTRVAVLDAVLQSQGHFDAEGLYYRMISNGTGSQGPRCTTLWTYCRSVVWFRNTVSPNTVHGTRKHSAGPTTII